MRGKPIYLPGMKMEGQTAKEIVGLPQLKVVGCHRPKKDTLPTDFVKRGLVLDSETCVAGFLTTQKIS